MEIGIIGNLNMLSDQHSINTGSKEKMVFINDCSSACINVLLQGFQQEQYILFNIKKEPTLNIQNYIQSEILPKINEKWSHLISIAYDGK